MRLFRVAALVAALAWAATSGDAAGATALSASIRPLVPRPRSGAPMWVDVSFQSPGSRLIEGQLEIVLDDGQALLGRYRSAPLAITTGRQSFRFLLPACAPATFATQAELRFRTDGELLLLGRQPLSLPKANRRQFVIGMCVVGSEQSPADPDLGKALRLETYGPVELPRTGLSYVTSLARLSPDDLPPVPLAYCAFDVVVLTAPAFAEVRAAALEALARWVQGGGSVCVISAGEMQDRQRAFLLALAGGDRAALAPGEEGIRMFRCGLGRAVVVPADADLPGCSSAQWRSAVAFLWKMCAQQQTAMVQDGHWLCHLRDADARPPVGLQQEFSLTSYPVEGWACLPEALLPEDVRAVPPGLLALLFLTFVGIVGPVDYWLLGLLRGRRWTWVLFPAVSVGFAVLAMWLSVEYMTSEHEGRALVFVDVGRDGRTLRRSRYELTFSSRKTGRWVQVRNALYSTRLLAQFQERPPSTVVGVIGDARETPPAYEGRFPGHYAVLRQLEQWRPQLGRFTALTPPDELPGLNWDAIRTEDLRTYRGRMLAAARLTDGRDFDGCIYHCSNLGFHYVAGDRELLGVGAPGGARLLDLVRDSCARPSAGLFSLVSQVSPHGSCDFEDLAAVDGTAPGAALLLAVRREGPDYVIYRRLYCGDE